MGDLELDIYDVTRKVGEVRAAQFRYDVASAAFTRAEEQARTARAAARQAEADHTRLQGELLDLIAVGDTVERQEAHQLATRVSLVSAASEPHTPTPTPTPTDPLSDPATQRHVVEQRPIVFGGTELPTPPTN